MNKRQIQKKKTREIILKQAKKCFTEKGFLNTTTSEIASESKIAHGTLFLHFKSKDMLIIEILDLQLEAISLKIIELIRDTNALEEILIKYLELLQKEEGFFYILAKELPFYNEQLRRKIIFRESIIRSKFVKAINEGIDKGSYIECDSVTATTFLFSIINHYLSLKEIYVSEGSVISKFKTRIVSTFISFLSKGEER